MKFKTYTPSQLLEIVKNGEAKSIWTLETGKDAKDDVLYDELSPDTGGDAGISSYQAIVNDICEEHDIEAFPKHWELKAVENPEQYLEKEIVDASITNQMLEDYLTSEWGWDLRIWSNGEYDFEQYNTSAESEVKKGDFWPYVISRIKCPGIGELSTEQFTGQFCSYDEEEYIYIELETKRKIGDFADVIRECIQDGDVTSEIDALRNALIENLRNC